MSDRKSAVPKAKDAARAVQRQYIPRVMKHSPQLIQHSILYNVARLAVQGPGPHGKLQDHSVRSHPTSKPATVLIGRQQQTLFLSPAPVTSLKSLQKTTTTVSSHLVCSLISSSVTVLTAEQSHTLVSTLVASWSLLKSLQWPTTTR